MATRLVWILPCITILWDAASAFVTSIQQQTTSVRGDCSSFRSGTQLNEEENILSSSSNSMSVVVDEMLELIQGGRGNSYSKKTREERERILLLMKKLEEEGSASRYLDDEVYIGRNSSDNNDDDAVGGTLLWDSYELAYFDRSIDGGRGSASSGSSSSSSSKEENNVDQYKNAIRPFGIRSKLLGSLFGLRYSFQHVVRPGRVVNDVGFKFLGLPAAVIAGGNFSKISQEDVLSIQSETGTQLRPDTAIRINFEAPVMWLGNKRFCPLIFNLGSKAQSPPVTLCTTYMDDRIRLALAAKGGRLVFTRGGKTVIPFAKDWEAIEGRRPISGTVVGAALAVAVGAVAKWIPSARVPIAVAGALPMIVVLRAKLFGGKRVETQDHGNI